MSTSAPNATLTKERLYTQLAASLGRMCRAISHTADLCEQLQVDLHAMRTFAGLDAAKFMAVAQLVEPEKAGEGEVRSRSASEEGVSKEEGQTQE